jgi:hypothetical protein
MIPFEDIQLPKKQTGRVRSRKDEILTGLATPASLPQCRSAWVTPTYVCHHIGPKYRCGVYELEKLISSKASSSIVVFALDDDDDEKKNKRSNAERKELFKFSLCV